MKRLFCGLLTIVCLAVAVPAEAADSKLNISIIRQADSAIMGEIWCNDKVVWRLKICTDGAQAVATGASTNTTVVIPDIVGGLFLLKVYNE